MGVETESTSGQKGRKLRSFEKPEALKRKPESLGWRLPLWQMQIATDASVLVSASLRIPPI